MRQTNSSGATLHVPDLGVEVAAGDEVDFGTLLPGFTATPQEPAADPAEESKTPRRRSKPDDQAAEAE